MNAKRWQSTKPQPINIAINYIILKSNHRTQLTVLTLYNVLYCATLHTYNRTHKIKRICIDIFNDACVALWSRLPTFKTAFYCSSSISPVRLNGQFQEHFLLVSPIGWSSSKRRLDWRKESTINLASARQTANNKLPWLLGSTLMKCHKKQFRQQPFPYLPQIGTHSHSGLIHSFI